MIALLTNDDGIDADGLNALRSVAESFFDEIWIVAPDRQMSQIGHRVTTDTPIRYEQRDERIFSVSGTPADCSRIALSFLMPRRPDWVLSGINHGGNLGRHDFVISGTVAAVREAAFCGIPGIALSHYLLRGEPLDWSIEIPRATRVVTDLLSKTPAPGEFWNVNLPHLRPGEPEPKAIYCEPEPRPLQVCYEELEPGLLSYTGDYHERPRCSDSDVDVCFRGEISITLGTI